MRSFIRAGIVLLIGAAGGACNKDSAAPVDFENPAAVSSNLSAVDGTFDTDVYRSFSSATFRLDAATAPAIRPAATLLGAVRPKLERTGALVFLPQLLQARKLQALTPNLSVAAAQGTIIPDSMYGRVFEWDTTGVGQYTYQGNTVANLNGVRFLLYAVGLDGEVFEPVTQIGTLDIIDLSTPSVARLQVLVKNTAGTTTFVDYTIEFTSTQTSAQATATGSISNGQTGDGGRELNFNQTLTVNANGARVVATFTLTNPALTLMLNESVAFEDPNVVINADFRVIVNNSTIRTVGRITINQTTLDIAVNISVYVDGHPVASISGDPTLPQTQWVDAGGEPLTLADLAALDDLFDALENFDTAVGGLFAPIATFAGL